MEFLIRVEPGGQQFTCHEDQAILAAAITANVLMPYSCRAGRCRSCCGHVDSGIVEYPNGFPDAIDEQDHKAGLALFCSAYPRSDLTIRVMTQRL